MVEMFYGKQRVEKNPAQQQITAERADDYIPFYFFFFCNLPNNLNKNHQVENHEKNVQKKIEPVPFWQKNITKRHQNSYRAENNPYKLPYFPTIHKNTVAGDSN